MVNSPRDSISGKGGLHKTAFYFALRVNIAVNMLCDSYGDLYDTAYLVSGDSDLTPIVEKIRLHFPQKFIIACFPPDRISYNLKRICHANRHLIKSEKAFTESQLPQKMTNKAGYIVECPAKWR